MESLILDHQRQVETELDRINRTGPVILLGCKPNAETPESRNSFNGVKVKYLTRPHS